MPRGQATREWWASLTPEQRAEWWRRVQLGRQRSRYVVQPTDPDTLRRPNHALQPPR